MAAVEEGLYDRAAAEMLKSTRPTAVNLAYAVDFVVKNLLLEKNKKKAEKTALKIARTITGESVEHCKKIGEYGLSLIEKINKN